MQRFTDIKAWQRSHAAALSICRLTASFPTAERYGLIAQLRRAAVSVPTNVAEGSKRRSAQDYARFLNVAEGSAAEVEYLPMLSRDLAYARGEEVAPLIEQVAEVASMLHGLRMAVEGGETR